MQIDIPSVRAELEAVFAAYETALLANDTDVLDAMFRAAPETVRYGVADIQHGIDEIKAFRAAQAPFERDLRRTVITTYGTEFGTAQTLFLRPDSPGQVGRQTQCWAKLDGRWLIVAAHVSMLDRSLPGIDEATR